jgi:hypothetical protein
MNRDDIIRMAREAGSYPAAPVDRALLLFSESHLERFAALVAAAEREACAKVCDSSIHDTYIGGYTGAIHSARRECAAAIRQRGQE